MGRRRTFNKEFKLEAVRLLELGQKSPTPLALGVWSQPALQGEGAACRQGGWSVSRTSVGVVDGGTDSTVGQMTNPGCGADNATARSA